MKQIQIKTIYYLISFMFLLSAGGSVGNFILSYAYTNAGQKVSILASSCISVLFFYLFFTTAEKTQISADFTEIVKAGERLKMKGGKNKDA